MVDLAEIEAGIAKAEAAGQKDLADKLRVYAEKLRPAPRNLTLSDIEAGIAKAEANGQMDVADKLRIYADKLRPPASAPVQPLPPDDDIPELTPPPVQDPLEKAADDLAAFEAANPGLRGRYRAGEQLPDLGSVVMGEGAGRAAAATQKAVQPWRAADIRRAADGFGETAVEMASGPWASAGAFAGGLTGGPSPTRDFLAKDPLTKGLPDFALTGLGGLGDAAGAALSGLGAGLGGLTGLAVEAVPGQNSTNEKKLAEDLTGMAMFAVPELAGVSSIPARAAAAAPKVAAVTEKAAPAVKAAVAKTPEEIGALTKKAASGGMGSVKAQEELAAAAKLNPEGGADRGRYRRARPLRQGPVG